MAMRKSRKGRKVAGKPAIKPSRKRRKRVPATPVKPHTTTPNMGWYADDQTGYKIARDTAERQRRFIAAQSSDATAPPLPLSDTAAFKGEGGLQVDTIIPRSAQYEEMLSRIAVLERLIVIRRAILTP